MSAEQPGEQVLSASPERFKEVVTHYAGYVYTLTYRILGNRSDAEEASQEVFVKAYVNLGRFDAARGWKNWLCTIALNTARDFYRSRKRERQFSAGALDVEKTPDRHEAAPAIDASMDTQKLLSVLDLKYRTVVVLFYLEQLDINEIALVLKKPRNLIKVWLFRARKQMLEKYGAMFS
jgi:RNA polymerase sigma-70 factor (ECF subfamily)